LARLPTASAFPYTTLFRSPLAGCRRPARRNRRRGSRARSSSTASYQTTRGEPVGAVLVRPAPKESVRVEGDRELRRRIEREVRIDRKSTRLNSSHLGISYA